MSVATGADARAGAAASAAQLEAWDRDCLFHASTHLAKFARGELPQRVMKRGEGVYLWDSQGNKLLDAFAGLYCVNVGYGRQEIAEAIATQARALAYYHAYVGHGTEAAIRLAHMVMERAPKGMSKVYFGLTGSDANETNVKLLWYYRNILGQPRKKKIISRQRGYHGSGIMSGSLTGLPVFHAKFDLPLPQVLHTEAPYYLRRRIQDQTEQQFSAECAARLEEMILAEGPETICALIAEPVLGTGGLVPPPAGYWAAIAPILKKYDILLVADEVITAFGRLGAMFGSPVYGLEPDLITIAKGLTSAYAPLSGSIVSERLWKVLERGTDEFGPIGHGWTYSAHPIGAAAGVANLELIDRLGLIENVRSIAPYLLGGLRNALAEHPQVGEVRGAGLMMAVELVADRATRRLFEPSQGVAAKAVAEMLSRGVIARAMPHSDIIGFAPPLCLTRGEADRIVEVTAEAVRATFA
jgi:L-2,4-diaminobutyrate transaminase